jgi:hypothetical protein
MTSKFGDIFDASLLEEAVIQFLDSWFKTYTNEISKQRGYGTGAFPSPNYWTTEAAITPDAVKQIRYPAVLVISSGTIGSPRPKGDGWYDATYQLGVTILAQASTDTSARKMALRYGAAVRAAMLQRQSLGTDFVSGLTWTEERFTDFITSKKEAVGSASEVFNIDVQNIVNRKRGLGIYDVDNQPSDDDQHDYGSNPTVRDPQSDPVYDPVVAHFLKG